MYYDLKKSGERIRKLRKLHGFTQEALADRLNISAGHMGKEPATETLRYKIRSMIEFLTALEKSL